MMKSLLLPALALTLLAGTALAQTPPAPAAGAAPQTTAVATPPAPPPAAAPDVADDDAGGAPPPPPGGPRGQRPPPPPPMGAHVHLQNGNRVLDVACAPGEPTKVCADVVGALMDRLKANP